MNINRHNYEEFFLLYVDGEMSEADQLTLEAFAEQHPDLKEELDMLLQVKLLPDEDVVFNDKTALYRTGSEIVDLDNCEEKFLLYIDNELSEQDRNKVETFVLQHPKLQNEFTLLKKTVLTPEVILHPNKEVLYKREKDSKPVIYMRWLRYSAAAVILGLTVSVWIMEKNKRDQLIAGALVTTPTKEQAASTSTERKRTETVEPQTPGQIEQPVKPNELTASTASLPKKRNSRNSDVIPAKFDDSKSGKGQMNLSSVSGNNTSTTSSGSRNGSDKDDPIKTSVAKTNVTNLTDHVEIPSDHVNVIYPEKNLIVRQAVDKSGSFEDKPVVAQQAVYRELNTEDDKSLYVGSLEINKDKLRGFARKVNRLFGKSKTTDNDIKTATATNK